jgi:hypothetical protein
MLSPDRGDTGAAALLVAISLVVLCGFAALAVDLGRGFNERRQDQTAADIGVMAGAIETLGSNSKIRDLILDFTRRNVIATYSSADWQARWEGCLDPERLALNGDGFNFQPVAAPAGWTTPSGRLDCISFDAGGYVRVNLPQLEFETTFGKLMGVSELETNADAVAMIANRAGGGVLPFALLITTFDGQHACLRDGSGGHAEAPCDGPDAGNFGALESPHYGTDPDGPSRNCTGSPKKDLVAVNIAYGIDHRTIPDSDGLGVNEVRDTCANMDKGFTPDTMNTFTGLSNGVAEGLATGPIPDSIAKPLLQQGDNPKRKVYGSKLDDKPLWEYIDPSLSVSVSPTDDIPASCQAHTFDPTVGTNIPKDWDGDGVKDEPNSWEHLSACLTEHVAGGHTAPLFLDTLEDSPRFGYVPMFWENSFGSGNNWLHIKMFKAAWIQGTWWKKGSKVTTFHPGEPGSFTSGGKWKLTQLSGLVVPDATLPSGLRGSPPPGGGVNPFEPELYR